MDKCFLTPNLLRTYEKAAHLLYFIVKNHSFVDGNKRIAAAIFTWFLERNDLLYKSDGTKRLADNALVALTLMIAMSDPKEKDIITKMKLPAASGRGIKVDNIHYISSP